MVKPVDLSEWGTGVNADLVEPPLQKKQDAWLENERPPAQYQNWLENVDYQWQSHVNTLTAVDVEFDDSITNLPGAPTDVQEAIEALKSYTDALDAQNISYTPDDNNNWFNLPSNPGDGLDELASRLTTVQYNDFVDTGVANAYVLNPIAGVDAPLVYYDGLTITFTPANTNTGACTVNVAGLGIKNLEGWVNFAGLTGGEIVAGRQVTIQYRDEVADFSLVNSSISSKNIIFTSSGNYIKSGAAKSILVRLVGGGGGGGGTPATGAGQAAAGSGGSGGHGGLRLFNSQDLPLVNQVTIGAGGSGGIGGGTGSNGGITSFSVGGTLLQVPGGSGGSAGGAFTQFSFFGNDNNGTVGAYSGTFDLTIRANPGLGGSSGGGGGIGQTTGGKGGSGGFSGVIGSGGGAGWSNSSGNNATNYGGGGSGAGAIESSPARNGGNGFQGVVIITEYF